MESEKALVVFQGKRIRRIWFDDGWYFVVNDLIEAITDSSNPSDYLKKVRSRDEGLKEGWGQIVTPLPIQTPGGRQQMNCVGTENAFRLIQSIPSKKAEPFKRWLARVGYERIQDRDHMNDLELIFTMLGEASTTEIARKKDSRGFDENKTAARKGGTIAGEARKNLEKETGNPVSSNENYLSTPEKRKRLTRKSEKNGKKENHN